MDEAGALDGHYHLVLILFGLLFLLAGWIPRELKNRPCSPAIVFVGFGVLIFSLFDLPYPDPLAYGTATERLCELLVVISLVITGLRLDRRVGWRSWASAWRLLAITLPLSVVAVALLGWWAVGLAPACALLLAAVLAPTDPVLAEDVQVGPPGRGRVDEVRFGLTSEGGINDGLVFPFVVLAVGLATAGGLSASLVGSWLLVDLLYRVAAAVVIGGATGYVLSRLLFHLPPEHRLAQRHTGFVVLAISLLVYGMTETLGGYGFLAVIVAPLVMRRLDSGEAYYAELREYAEGTEQLLRVIVLVLFGGAIAGGLLAPLTPAGVFAGIAIVLLVRPVLGLLAFARSAVPFRERLALGFFGIRGVATFFYLAWALNSADFQAPELLWAMAGLVVLGSVVVHGISSSPVMRYFDRHWRELEDGAGR